MLSSQKCGVVPSDLETMISRWDFRSTLLMFTRRWPRLAFSMNAKISLVELFPRAFIHWRTLPLFGDHLDDFIDWLRNQGYAIASVRNYLNALPRVVRRLRRKRVKSLAQLSEQKLRAARNYYRSREPNVSCAVSILIRFFGERGILAEGEPTRSSPMELELDHFARYLCDVRGLVIATLEA